MFGGRKRDHHIEFRAKSCVTVANGTSKDEYGRCPIESGMTGRVGQDVDEVGHDGERDEAGREDRRGFPIDVGDD